NDLAHVPPAHDEDLGHGERIGEGGDRREVAREMAQALSRVTSTGFVRGNIKSLAVVRSSGAATALAIDHVHDHEIQHVHPHEIEEIEHEIEAAMETGIGAVADALSEVRAQVM